MIPNAPDIKMIKEIEPNTYEIPIGFVPNMKVPGKFFATPQIFENSIKELKDWIQNQQKGIPSLIQIANAATLDGVYQYSLAMPDLHSGYGFSIGGVAAFDMDDPKAVISPGGVGYDINCGVRCLTSNLNYDDILPFREKLVDTIFNYVPSGVGGKRVNFINMNDLNNILTNGAKWCLDNKYATQEDLDNCEENGCMEEANHKLLSQRIKGAGINQLGTLGSGNHFIEIQRVDTIFDQESAAVMNLHKDQIVVMIHCGSRCIGERVAVEYIQKIQDANSVCLDSLPDRELVSVPIQSDLGKEYFQSMAAAANFAWANRQTITYFVRKAFKEVLGRDDISLDLLYDVAHNVAKIENHKINGVSKKLLVYRKGASRSFGPGSPEIPEKYRSIGQPVLIGGSMGTASYILTGTSTAMEKTFGSTCHGAGRALSRSTATKRFNKDAIEQLLKDSDIIVKAAGNKTLAEEAPQTYKDIDEIISVCNFVGLSKPVAKTVPLCVIKG